MPATRLNISLPEKLSLPGANKRSMLFLTAGHMFLALNIISIYFGIFPFIGLFLAFTCFSVEYYHREIMAKDAVVFAYKRILLNIMVIISSIILVPIYAPSVDNVQMWNLLLLTLGPLSFFDAYQTAKGKIGIRIIYYIKEALLDKLKK